MMNDNIFASETTGVNNKAEEKMSKFPVLNDGKTWYTLIIFSENLAGVLNQITNVFTRHQMNIESLNVSPSGFKGLHRYTVTCRSDFDTMKKVVKQIEKKIDVVLARFYTEDHVYVMEQALYKIETSKLIANHDISKAIRKYEAKIVEVNATYSIVSIEGLPSDIVELRHILRDHGCMLQFVSSGIVAVTKSKHEELNSFLKVRNLQKEAITED